MRDSNAEWLELLRSHGAIVEAPPKAQFALSSGKHTDKFIDVSRLYAYPGRLDAFVAKLGRSFLNKLSTMKFNEERRVCLVGVAMGGVPIAYELAKFCQLEQPKYLGRDEENHLQFSSSCVILKPGLPRSAGSLLHFDNADNGTSIVIVDDVMTTGGQVEAAKSVIRHTHSNLRILPVNLTVVDRTAKENQFEGEIISAVKVKAPIYSPESCPMCASRYQIVPCP